MSIVLSTVEPGDWVEGARISGTVVRVGVDYIQITDGDGSPSSIHVEDVRLVRRHPGVARSTESTPDLRSRIDVALYRHLADIDGRMSSERAAATDAVLAVVQPEIDRLRGELADEQHGHGLTQLSLEWTEGSLRAENKRLSQLTATCTCDSFPGTTQGPEEDCAVHGAVRALNDASRLIESLRAENKQLNAEIDELRRERDKAQERHSLQLDIHADLRTKLDESQRQNDQLRRERDEARECVINNQVIVGERERLRAHLERAVILPDNFADHLAVFFTGARPRIAQHQYEEPARDLDEYIRTCWAAHFTEMPDIPQPEGGQDD